MAEIRLTQASQDALKARLATPEGRAALQKLADLIAQTALEAMPPEVLASPKTKKGTAAFRAAWPDIVDAFLFRRVNKPTAPAGTRKRAKRSVTQRRIPAK